MVPIPGLLELATSQSGVVSRDQAISLGLSKDQLYRLTRSGFWRLVMPGVYIVKGFPETLEQRVYSPASPGPVLPLLDLTVPLQRS